MINQRLIDNGLMGLLSPNGYFYQCGFGEHHELARKLIDEGGLNRAKGDSSLVEEYDWLYFGGTFISGSKASKEQKEFLRVNLKQLSSEQKDYVMIMFLSDGEGNNGSI